MAARAADSVGGWGDPGDVTELAESLSTAFLVMLERLAPVDRAVLLLHDVFGYPYSEIAPMIGRNAADVRQIGHRAHTRISAEKPRFSASSEEAEKAAQEFMHALTDGDLPKLLSVLAEDVTLLSDGGGKVKAARNPILGADHVARFFIGLHRKETAPPVLRLARVNGQPALIEYRGERAVRVNTFVVESGRIRTIFRVLNPDKLSGIG